MNSAELLFHQTCLEMQEEETIRVTAALRKSDAEVAGLKNILFENTHLLNLRTIERDNLRKLINTPEILDFTKAVEVEAAHQRDRWGSSHDAGKTDADWFWLIGYLAGKALHNPLDPDATLGEAVDKKLHRIITIAAAAANWHYALRTQDHAMRPGIETPRGEE